MSINHFCITDADRLEALGSEWSELLKRSDADRLFMSLDWIVPYVTTHGGDERLNVYLLREREKLVGIIPLFERKKEGARQLNVIGVGRSDYVDFILDPDAADDCVSYFVRRLLPEISGWDLFRCSRLVEGRRTITLLEKELARQQRFRFKVEPADVAPFIPTTGDWSSYTGETLKQYKNYKTTLRRLERDFGPVTVERATTEEQVRAWYPRLVELHKVRRDDIKNDHSMFNAPAVADFYLEASLRALKAGTLYFIALRSESEILALQLNFAVDGRLYYLVPVMNWDYAKYSVGRLLTVKLVESCFLDGIREMDLGYGDESYKHDLTNSKRRLRQITVANRTVRGRTALWWFDGMRQSVRDNPYFMEKVLPRLKSRGLVKEGA